MLEQDPPDGNDPLLLPFLRASDEAQAQRHLELLIGRHAEPVISRILKRRFPDAGSGFTRNGRDREDAEDLKRETVLQLLRRLRGCRSDPGERPIANFCAYVAIA